jgi:hypothetical protein
MTARDTIAKTLLYAVGVEPDSDDVTALLDALPVADAVIAAVRAMPVEDQAELIGGTVTFREPREADAEHFFVEVGR